MPRVALFNSTHCVSIFNTTVIYSRFWKVPRVALFMIIQPPHTVYQLAHQKVEVPCWIILPAHFGHSKHTMSSYMRTLNTLITSCHHICAHWTLHTHHVILPAHFEHFKHTMSSYMRTLSTIITLCHHTCIFGTFHTHHVIIRAHFAHTKHIMSSCPRTLDTSNTPWHHTCAH